MGASANSTEVSIITIPTNDLAFSQIVNRLHTSAEATTPAVLEARLRKVFPRAVVRARDLTGEPPAWYVYRDGAWTSSLVGPWWEAPELPRVVVSQDGWVLDANATARGLLGIELVDMETRHFTDFVAPGALED